MIKIADIKELKLNITWKLLYRGLLEKQISINEIIEYAKEQLEKGDDRIEICELAGSSDLIRINSLTRAPVAARYQTTKYHSILLSFFS